MSVDQQELKDIQLVGTRVVIADARDSIRRRDGGRPQHAECVSVRREVLDRTPVHDPRTRAPGIDVREEGSDDGALRIVQRKGRVHVEGTVEGDVAVVVDVDRVVVPVEEVDLERERHHAA
ncbi:hypothetical protein WME98_28460 [Sorangium sp. So ce296]